MGSILIADDDREIAEIISSILERAGYKSKRAYNGEEAIEAIRSGKIDLVILDIMMPKMNGIEAAIRIRETSNIPILMLSAKSENTDKVIGLTSGADDYITKPFYSEELTARVDALLRRYTKLGSVNDKYVDKSVSYYDIKWVPENRKLYVRGKEVKLTATEYKITELLLMNIGRIFTAEEIYERCWDSDAYAVENTVMIHISRIRKKIELNPSKPEYLKVVWGIGYKIEKG